MAQCAASRKGWKSRQFALRAARPLSRKSVATRLPRGGLLVSALAAALARIKRAQALQ
jgi:hypothetical protein